MTRATFFLACACLLACGDDDDGKTFDAPPTANVDAPPAAVVSVSCPASPAQTITTPGNLFSPSSSTIQRGQIVKFDPSTGHDVEATSPAGAFSVSLGGEGCFRFDAAGTYNFRCNVHGFTGSITVQ